MSVAWLGWRFELEDPAAPLKGHEPQQNVSPIVSAEAFFSTTIGDEVPSDTVVQRATAVAHEEELASELGANMYTRFNTPFVRFLVNRGLSTQDSERVIGDAFGQAAMCWVAAVRAQVEAEGGSFDTTVERDSGALSDSSMLNQISASCINSALERVGVNPPMGIKAIDARIPAPSDGPVP